MARAQGSDRGRNRGGLRIAVLVIGCGLAGAATVAVLATRDPQLLRLAVVGALWAFLLAALAVPRLRDSARVPADLPAGREIELRRTYEMELEREVVARREYELQLEVYLRRQLEQSVQQDVEALREEVRRLRSEVLDRLDGELRMERIETTRLIGGGLRALQDEARRLGISRGLIAEGVGGPLEEPGWTGAEPGPPAELAAGVEPDQAGGAPLYGSLQRPAESFVPEYGRYEPASPGNEPPGHQPAAPAWPANEPSTREPSGYERPGNEPSRHEQPGYQPPGYESPSYERPGYLPTREPPGYEPRGNERAGYELSGRERPGYQPLGYEPPTRERPGNELPGHELPGRDRAGLEPPGYELAPGGRARVAEPWPGGRPPDLPQPVPPVVGGPAPGALAAEPVGGESGPHGAPEPMPGSVPTPWPPHRDQSAAPPEEMPAYRADDELSRIFAGTMGPSPQRVPPGESVGQRRRRRREDGEQNDVLTRLLGRS